MIVSCQFALGTSWDQCVGLVCLLPLPKFRIIQVVEVLRLKYLIFGGVSHNKLAVLIVDLLKGTIHSPVRVHLLPVSIVVPLYFTVAPILVRRTSHPALHSVTAEIRECKFSPGMTCAILAFRGS